MTILPFTSSHAILDTVGGKGANLARLTRAGFSVPPGFIITTAVYHDFVEANKIADPIHAALAGLSLGDSLTLERASQTIRSAFSSGTLPPGLKTAISEAYAALWPSSAEPQPVAVRSSATAEDLPDLSFAGQQDTFLNVIGEAQLLKAVVDCWSSLWTGRAIGYRLRNGIRQDEAALAVVVQVMVPSEVSGVMFTANPLTGLCSETVIDATFGLGEALVSGQVEPDHYVADSLTGGIIESKLGQKKLSTRSRIGGGVETVTEATGTRPSLSDDDVRQVVALGRKVQQEYGAPQDIEWALAEGRLYLLQARPITSLYPPPVESLDPLIIWFSFGAVQGLLDPLTPLGQDIILCLVAGAGRMLGQELKPGDLDLFALAGERIWIKISDVMRHPIGSRVLGAFLPIAEPSTARLLQRLSTDPRLGAGKGKLKLSTLYRTARFFLPMLRRVPGVMLTPEKARQNLDADIDRYLAAVRIPPATDRFARLAAIIALTSDRISSAFPFLLPRFGPLFVPSLVMLHLLGRLAERSDTGGHGFSMLTLEVTRGLPKNVTTEMDLALWETAQAIRSDTDARHLFLNESPGNLSAAFRAAAFPPVAQNAIAAFIERYGMRGVAEFDIGRSRWREDPTPVMQTLQSYLEIEPEAAPDVLFARGEQAAHEAVERLAQRARRQPGGWLKEKLVRGAARRVRALLGARESPKFTLIRVMGVIRKALLDVGEEFAAAGDIDRADDLVYLHLVELEALARDDRRDWKALIGARRVAYTREMRRRQVPRVLVSDGRALYEGLGAETDSGDTITGSPVSPGVVEGVVHVVLDPHGTRLAPGEILVCPGTDPAWTPLFMAAGGLITEVGGMMTHGSVVAREYGIPAVVGVHQATIRLKDGQRIRLDGTTGMIVMIGRLQS